MLANFNNILILKKMFRILSQHPVSGDVYQGIPCKSFTIDAQSFLLDPNPLNDTFRFAGIPVQVFPLGIHSPSYHYSTWIKAEFMMTKNKALTVEQWARPNMLEWSAASVSDMELVLNTSREFEAIRYLTDGSPILAEVKGGAEVVDHI